MRIYRHDLPSAASPLALEEDFFFSSCSWGGGSVSWKCYEDHHEDVYGKPIMKNCRVFLLLSFNVIVNVKIDQVARTSQRGGFIMSKAEIRKSLLKEKS